MSILTSSSETFRLVPTTLQAKAAARPVNAARIAMIKRYTAFTLMLGGFAIVVAAVIAVKLAVFLPPHLFH
jgi:hypothetical protein